MTLLNVPRLLLGGTSSRVGKSLLAMGMAMALRKRGVGLSCCVVGPNLQQGTLFHRLSRRYTRFLDGQVLSTSQLAETIRQAGRGADIVFIDGQGGLFDGFGSAKNPTIGSDGQVAALTGTPVVLVADVTGITHSLAAIVKGFSSLSSEVSIGAVAGTLRGPMGNEALAELTSTLTHALRHFELPPYIGGIPRLPTQVELPSVRFSQRKSQTTLPMQFFVEVGQAIEAHINIDRLLEVANAAPPLVVSDSADAPQLRKGRLAVTDDSCFGLCFQDNLDLLRFYGCEIVPFSPLADSELPDRIGGLYITGAFLEFYGEELQNNLSLYESILQFIERGGVVYSEGAGTAYLCSRFGVQPDAMVRGVGLIPGDAVLQERGWSYVEAEIAEDSVLGALGERVRGLSTGEWAVENLEMRTQGPLVEAFRTSSSLESDVPEGYSPTSQSLCTFNFLHFGSNQNIARNLAEAVQVASGTPQAKTDSE